METNTDPGIGTNVRRARRYQGLTLAQLAGRVGRSKGWLSMIENGRLPLEKRSDIAALADALEISVADLLGRPFPAFSSEIPDIGPLREVMLENGIGDPAALPATPLEAARSDLDSVTAAWRDGDHLRQAALLPPLITELHAHTTGRDSADALELLTRASVFASDLAKELGQTDLAWIAADRARQAAQAHGGGETAGMAAWAVALAQPSAARSRGLMRASGAADGLEECVRSGSVLAAQVYGMLRVTAALGSHLAGDRDASAGQLADAVEVAGRVGEQPERWEAFGPANAGVWAVMLAVESGEPGKALDTSERVNPDHLVSAGRRAALHLERARALSMLGRRDDAVAELRDGERACALRIRCDPLARDLVGTMLERARSKAGGRELRGLAWRMGVVRDS